MKLQYYLVFILLFALISTTACSSEAEETPEAPTKVSVEAATAEPTAATPATPTAEEAAAEPTAAAADTPPPAAEAEVQAQALTNLNLRSGPGTNYGIAGALAENAQLIVIGRNEDSSWLYVETDEGDKVWLTGDPGLVKVDQASVANLPVVEAPPPAYNAGNPMVNKILNQVPLVVLHEQNITCASHGGLNKLLPEVRDGNVMAPHAGDFVYDGNNVLFKLSGGSIVLIRENPTARFEGGAEFLPLDKALQLFESGDIVWTGDFGQPGRGVQGCDPSTP